MRRSLVARLGLVVGLPLVLVACQSSDNAIQTKETFKEQVVKRSTNGVLQTEITAASSSANVDGRTITGLQLFNGMLPSETWRVKPGDHIKLRLNNKLTKKTNLHFHGFHTSPGGISDNVFIEIQPGTSQDYDVAIPENHSSGLFWYHPHFDGPSNEQVAAGLAGLIVIEGDHDQDAGVKPLKERVMMLQKIITDDKNALVVNASGTVIQTVNGQVNPTLTAAPGETQFFRLGNASNDGYFRVQVPGHTLRVLAEDGIAYVTPEDVDEFLLPPGKRVEFLVQFKTAGTYTLRNAGYKWGFGETPAGDLATVVVEGKPSQGAAVLPAAFSKDPAALSKLLNLPLTRTRRIVFTIVDNPVAELRRFQVNGKDFNHHRVDVQAKLGDVEEWELVNDSTDEHPFHIHINDFVVTEINGKPVAKPHLQDVVSIPANGSIKIRQQYTDFPGKFVFHCHILFHEDHGMMSVVEILR